MCWGKVFAALDPVEFSTCFSNWVNSIEELTGGEVVAVDGKTICGSDDKGLGKSALRVVSAYASGNRLCLGQEAVDEKSNEITAIPELLKLPSVKGCIITIDAMGCQKAIAEAIIDKEADYVLPCPIFFSSSLIVSIIERFLNKILSFNSN